MPLVLPEGHPARAATDSSPRGEGLDGAAIRVGIVNIMPKLESYEPLLLAPLSRLARPIEPVFIRLESHTYGSSDHEHLDRYYHPYDAAIARRPLDGLVITGAPVEELPFEEVHYWRELSSVLDHARSHVKSTLGLCWGGMALGGLLGIPKVLFPKKLFGVFHNHRLVANNPIVGSQDAKFPCAHSRHSGMDDLELERAERGGRVRLLSHSGETGYSMFETPDHRFVMHLGHPEYVGERIAFEWSRDRALGRDDVSAPHDFDSDHPTTSWHTHRERLFASWIELVSSHE